MFSSLGSYNSVPLCSPSSHKTQNCLFHVGRNERGAIGDTDVQTLSEGFFVCRMNILFCRNCWHCLILYSQREWNLSPEQNWICTKKVQKYIFCFCSHYIIYNIFKRVKRKICLLSRWIEVYRQDVITAFLYNWIHVILQSASR